MTSFRVQALIVAALLSSSALGQAPQGSAPPQLSPKAAYDDAMHPLEVTRHSIANWSDTEKQALGVAIGRAGTECAARDPKSFTGDALVDLARLCALGQSWPAVVQSTALYISADTPAKPLLNQAYAAQIDAQLHLKDEPSALAGAQAMLGAVAYDALAAEAIDEAVAYMQFADTADALTLDTAREPLLLTRIRAASIAPGRTPPPAPTSTYPPQFIHDLYATGLAFAALQQLAGQPEAALATVTELDAALPKSLTPDDTIPIAAARKRYAFLGQPLPVIKMLASLTMPNKLPELPAAHAITSLLLFPDWCAQCVRMGSQFPQSVFLVEKHEAYFYALFAETAPNPQRAPTTDGTPPKPTPRDLLAETPTVVVPPSVLDQFAASDFPFLIIADSHGIIRVIQPVDEDVLRSGSTLDTAIARVAAQFPLTSPKATSDPEAVPGPKATASPQP